MLALTTVLAVANPGSSSSIADRRQPTATAAQDDVRFDCPALADWIWDGWCADLADASPMVCVCCMGKHLHNASLQHQGIVVLTKHYEQLGVTPEMLTDDHDAALVILNAGYASLAAMEHHPTDMQLHVVSSNLYKTLRLPELGVLGDATAPSDDEQPAKPARGLDRTTRCWPTLGTLSLLLLLLPALLSVRRGPSARTATSRWPTGLLVSSLLQPTQNRKQRRRSAKNKSGPQHARKQKVVVVEDKSAGGAAAMVEINATKDDQKPVLECSICLEEVTELWAILPCFHATTCLSCINSLQAAEPEVSSARRGGRGLCPTCRGPVEDKRRVYI